LLRWCIAQGHGTARWRFANNVAAVLSFDSRDARIAAIDDLGDPLTTLAFKSLEGRVFPRRQALAPPGAVVTVELPQGTEDSPVSITAANSVLAPTFLLRQVGKLLPEGATAEKIRKTWGAIQSCGFVYNQSQRDLQNVLLCAVKEAIDLGLPALSKVLSTYLAGLDALVSAGESISVSLFDPFSLSLTYANQTTTGTPSGSQQGSGDNPSAESTPAGRYIVKVGNSNASWVLDGGGVLHPIADTSTYYCNAQVMKVRYNTPRVAVDAAPKGVSGNRRPAPNLRELRRR
jgi:hypothetical protein